MQKKLRLNIDLTVSKKTRLNSFVLNKYPSNNELKIHFEEKLKLNYKTQFKNSFIYQVGTLLPIRYRIKLLTQILLSKFYNGASISQLSIFQLSQICKQKCKPYVVYIPNHKIMRPDARANIFKNNLRKYASNSGILFIDAEEVIDNESKNDYAPKGAHLSNEGYKKVSELIFKYIN